jgi:hypothetical protein
MSKRRRSRARKAEPVEIVTSMPDPSLRSGVRAIPAQVVSAPESLPAPSVPAPSPRAEDPSLCSGVRTISEVVRRADADGLRDEELRALEAGWDELLA